MGSCKFLQICSVHQIQADPQVNDRADNGWSFDASSRQPWIVLRLNGEFHRTQGIVFPKVDAMAQPVVIVLAGSQMFVLLRQHLLSHLFVAPVKAQHQARHSLIQAVLCCAVSHRSV